MLFESLAEKTAYAIRDAELDTKWVIICFVVFFIIFIAGIIERVKIQKQNCDWEWNLIEYKKIVDSPDTPTDILIALVNEDLGWRLHEYMATSENMPVPVLEMLAKDKDFEVRKAVAENKNSPASILEKLSNDKDSDVRAMVAASPAATPAVLEMLARDKDKWVRENVAKNLCTPINVLEALAGDEDTDIRMYSRITASRIVH